MGLTADFKAEFDLQALVGANGLQIPIGGRGGVVVTGETDLFAFATALNLDGRGLGLPLPGNGVDLTVARLGTAKAGVAVRQTATPEGPQVLSLALPDINALPITVDFGRHNGRITIAVSAIAGTSGLVRVFVADPKRFALTLKIVVPQAGIEERGK